MRIAIFAALLFALALIASSLDSASAAPRQWKDASGQFSVSAELVEVKNGEVHLKKADGEVIVVVGEQAERGRSELSGGPRRRQAGGRRTCRRCDNSGRRRRLDRHHQSCRHQRRRQAFAHRVGESGAEVSYVGRRQGQLARCAELEATDEVELVMKLADADGDEKIARAEWAQFAQAFPRLDKGRDGSIDRDELETAAKSSSTRAAGTASLAGK